MKGLLCCRQLCRARAVPRLLPRRRQPLRAPTPGLSLRPVCFRQHEDDGRCFAFGHCREPFSLLRNPECFLHLPKSTERAWVLLRKTFPGVRVADRYLVKRSVLLSASRAQAKVLLGNCLQGGANGSGHAFEIRRRASHFPGARVCASSVHKIFWKQTDGLSRLGWRGERLEAGRQKYLHVAFGEQEADVAEVWRGAGTRCCAGTYPGSAVLPPASPLPPRAEQLSLPGSLSVRTMSDSCLRAGEVCLGQGGCAVPCRGCAVPSCGRGVGKPTERSGCPCAALGLFMLSRHLLASLLSFAGAGRGRNAPLEGGTGGKALGEEFSSEGRAGPGWSLRRCLWPRARECLAAGHAGRCQRGPRSARAVPAEDGQSHGCAWPSW